MRRIANQAGFSVVETLIVVVVLAALGFVGYKVYSRQHDNSATTASSQSAGSAKANDVATAPDVKSTSDLDKAAATLDQTDPAVSNNTDSSQLSSQAGSF